jgi:hypothetical protein
VIAALDDRELGHVLAALRLYQRVIDHSADLGDVATDDGRYEPMSPDEIDDLCERLNLAPKTVGAAFDGLPSMVVQNDGDTWCALEGTELAFLPEETDSYNDGVEASAIIGETTFSPATGVFDLARLIRELPLDVLETYRLEAGKRKKVAR